MAQMFRFEAITPKVLKTDEVRLELLNELRNQGREVRRLYQKTTKTWKRKPKFEMKIALPRVGDPSVEVFTDSDIYRYIDEGTKRRIIRARRAPLLKFRVGGKAKTKSRRITSYKGRRGKHWRSAKSVRHPGIKAREFTPTIYDRREKKFYTAMKRAMNKGIKKAERG